MFLRIYAFQAHKFLGVDDHLAKETVECIKSAKSPEEAARTGRMVQRKHPNLVGSYTTSLN